MLLRERRAPPGSARSNMIRPIQVATKRSNYDILIHPYHRRLVYSLRALIPVQGDPRRIETDGRPEYISGPSAGVWFEFKEPRILDYYRHMESQPSTENRLKHFDVRKKLISHQLLETEDNRWGHYHFAKVDVENSLFKPTCGSCVLTRACTEDDD